MKDPAEIYSEGKLNVLHLSGKNSKEHNAQRYIVRNRQERT